MSQNAVHEFDNLDHSQNNQEFVKHDLVSRYHVQLNL